MEAELEGVEDDAEEVFVMAVPGSDSPWKEGSDGCFRRRVSSTLVHRCNCTACDPQDDTYHSRNYNNLHCNHCQCRWCVCDMRRSLGRYSGYPLTAWWDSRCRNSCYSCQRACEYGEGDSNGDSQVPGQDMSDYGQRLEWAERKLQRQDAAVVERARVLLARRLCSDLILLISCLASTEKSLIDPVRITSDVHNEDITTSLASRVWQFDTQQGRFL
jgi:hypothetical protein